MERSATNGQSEDFGVAPRAGAQFEVDLDQAIQVLPPGKAVSNLNRSDEEKYTEETNFHSRVDLTPEGDEDDDEYDPIEPPSDYPSIDYRPMILRDWCLCLSFLFYAGCLAGLVVLLVLDRTRPDRLHTHLSSYHVATRYLPAIVGAFTVILWRAISHSYFRYLPYIFMAAVPTVLNDEKDRAVRLSNILGRLAINETFPAAKDLIKEGHLASGIINITAFLTVLFVTPFKGSLLQTTKDSTGWAMNVVDGIAAILIGLYAMLLVSLVVIWVDLRRKKTGLRWDPASLAAQIALLRVLNHREAFERSEYCNSEEYRELTCGLLNEYGMLRLGYWQNRKTQRIVHGIGFIRSGARIRGTGSYAPDSSRITHAFHRPSPRLCHGSFYTRNHEKPLDSFGRAVCSPEYVHIRSSWCWILPVEFQLLFLGLIAVICIISSINYMANGKIYEPFRVNAYGVDPQSFVGRFQRGLIFGFLPAFVFNLFSIAFFNADIHYRSEQPLQELSTPQLAEKNLLLDYMTPDPVSTIFTALSNGHYRVALFSFLALTSVHSVVVAGGIFSTVFHGESYRVLLNRTNFYASFTILIVYLVILPFVRAPGSCQFPRKWLSILNTISYVYDSRILDCEEFAVDAETDEERHFQARIIVNKRLWCFGMYEGLSGRRHLGISPSKIPGRPSEIVDRIKPGFALLGYHFQKPTIEPAE